jgi:hypothetical protein
LQRPNRPIASHLPQEGTLQFLQDHDAPPSQEALLYLRDRIGFDQFGQETTHLRLRDQSASEFSPNDLQSFEGALHRTVDQACLSAPLLSHNDERDGPTCFPQRAGFGNGFQFLLAPYEKAGILHRLKPEQSAVERGQLLGGEINDEFLG